MGSVGWGPGGGGWGGGMGRRGEEKGIFKEQRGLGRALPADSTLRDGVRRWLVDVEGEG